jgi:hypothetical protein
MTNLFKSWDYYNFNNYYSLYYDFFGQMVLWLLSNTKKQQILVVCQKSNVIKIKINIFFLHYNDHKMILFLHFIVKKTIPSLFLL